LLLHDEHDPWITSAEIATVHDQLRGPKRFVQIPGVGHAMPFVYVAPELWVQTVRDFLAEHG
jgi:pimeloyl-ACP methyl ester carboxylesterase